MVAIAIEIGIGTPSRTAANKVRSMMKGSFLAYPVITHTHYM